MRTIWALLPGFDNAAVVFAELLKLDLKQDDISLLLQAVSARGLEWDELAAAGEVRQADHEKLAGLDKRLAGHQPMRVPDTGPLLAVGTLGGMLGQNASAATKQVHVSGLQGALVDYGLSESQARAFASAVATGQVLCVVRTKDGQDGDAVGVLRCHGGQHIIGIP